MNSGLRFLTAGESHGPCLTGILEGMPAGLPLSLEEINQDLMRRQQGFGSGGRMKIEKDEIQILGGTTGGMTIGAPLALRIDNLDWANWKDKVAPALTAPRPGHADLVGGVKYGMQDMRPILERASARETAMRVGVGSICKRLLEEFGIRIGSYVTSIGTVEADLPDDLPYEERFLRAEASDVRCPDPQATEAMHQLIRETILKKDTLGGIYEVVALGVPIGLGSHVHWDRKLDGRLAQAVMSIHAMKGVEIGPAFENTRRPGTEVHDEIFLEDGWLVRHTNRAGGLEGGITTGMPLVVRAAMKPISTTLKPLRTIDTQTLEPALAQYQRSDFTAVPRACVVGEAMVAFVLADALVEKLGGDSIAEMKARYDLMKAEQRAFFKKTEETIG
ncbi:MAG: chorismate synthase [Chloroflexi bacterium]|nr:chorismate synthase [Chloroflexota bacterium]